MKLAGSLCMLGGGFLIWWCQHRERERRRDTLSDLIRALDRLAEEIRMSRTPLPVLLERLAATCRPEAALLLRETAGAVKRGEPPEITWRKTAARLPLTRRELEVLGGLCLHGDEADICKECSLVSNRLAGELENWDRSGPEAERRAAALCFSGAALLVILLI